MFCIQESMLGNYLPSVSRYAVTTYLPTDYPIAGTELLTFTRNDLPFHKFSLITQMQAKFYRVS